MRKRVSRKDVAKAAGVSPTTVSFVLNGRNDMAISEETVARVLSTAETLGYRMNRAAQSLSTGRTYNVALWMTVLCPIYYSQVVDNVQRNLSESGYEMMVTDTAGTHQRSKHLNRLSHWPVDGIIAFDCPGYVREFNQHYAGLDLPFVTMGADVCEELDYVRLDLYPGTREAIEHLVSSGRRRIGYVADQYGYSPNEARYRAYIEVLEEAGLEPEIITVPGRTRALAYPGLISYCQEHGCPSGLFCYNDEIAIGVHRALWTLGYKMPDDVMVVGHDGIVDTLYLEPQLSSVVLPTREMCDTAWEFLKNRLEDPEIPQQTKTLTTRLRVAASSRVNSDPGESVLIWE